jgi:hypothetical protein
MNKKIFFRISIILNIILAIVFVVTAIGASEELMFNYVEEDTITPETIMSNLERENYGVAAALSHPIRGGADIDDEYMEYYMIGEYADLMFLKEIFAKAGNTQTVEECEYRLDVIRNEMPAYGTMFYKIDWSAENAGPK